MAHQENSQNLSRDEMVFFDLINHGDDFMKIEIYRNARECYTQAFEKNINNELAGSKLAECNKLIKSESKVIIAIVSIMAIVAAVLLFLV
jgi:hypothetical protein